MDVDKIRKKFPFSSQGFNILSKWAFLVIISQLSNGLCITVLALAVWIPVLAPRSNGLFYDYLSSQPSFHPSLPKSLWVTTTILIACSRTMLALRECCWLHFAGWLIIEFCCITFYPTTTTSSSSPPPKFMRSRAIETERGEGGELEERMMSWGERNSAEGASKLYGLHGIYTKMPRARFMKERGRKKGERERGLGHRLTFKCWKKGKERK